MSEEEDTFSPTPKNAESLPKVGDIIEVPIGIVWQKLVTPTKLTKEQKKIAKHQERYRKMGGPRVEIAPNVNYDGEIQDDEEDDDDEEPQIILSDDDEGKEETKIVSKPPKGFKPIKADGEAKDIIQDIIQGTVETKVIRGKLYEKGIDWVERDLPTDLTEEQKELAERMDMPKKIRKFVPIPVWNRVQDAKLTHERVVKMEIGPLGKLFPIREHSGIKKLNTTVGIILKSGQKTFEFINLETNDVEKLRYSKLKGYEITPTEIDYKPDDSKVLINNEEYKLGKISSKIPDKYSDILPGMTIIYYSEDSESPEHKIEQYYTDITPTKSRSPPKPPSSYKGDIKYGDLIEFKNEEEDYEKENSGIIMKVNGNKLVIIDLFTGTPINVNIDDIIDEEIYDTNEAYIINKGEGRYTVGGREYTISKGNKNLKKYKLGNTIKYTYKTNGMSQGTVVGFKPEEFFVREVSEGRRSFLVRYDDPSIKIIRSYKAPVYSLVKPIDLYDNPVDPLLRDIVRQQLLNITLDLIEYSETHKSSSPDTSPLVSEVIPDKLTWNDYYKTEYQKYHYSVYHPQIIENMPIDNIRISAEAYVNNYKNPEYLADYIADKFGKDIYDTSAGDLLDRINKYPSQKSLIDIELQSQLVRIPNLYDIKEYDFAVLLSNILASYLIKYPMNIEQIYNDMINRYIADEYSKLDPSKDKQLQSIFDENHLSDLKVKYDEYSAGYDNYKKSIIANTPPKSKKATPINIKKQLISDIEKFEEDIYASEDDGIVVLDYLYKVLLPYVFMNKNGVTGSQSKFFQSKIKNGQFKISKLIKANYAHYLPELFMNKKLKDSDIEYVSEKIGQELLTIINLLLINYIHVKNPAQQRRQNKYPIITIKWSDYIVNPIEVCNSDTNTGYEVARDKKGNIIYDITDENIYARDKKGKVILGKNKKPKVEKIIRKKIARLEPIPLGNLVLCYTQETDKFTCHSQSEILRLIAKSNEKQLINPYTNLPFPKSFVSRMKKRYKSGIKSRRTYKSPPKSEKVFLEEIEVESSEELEELEIDEVSISEKGITTIDELNILFEKSNISVLYLYAEWCPPCKLITESGKWDDLINEYGDSVHFEKIDIDKFKEIQKLYQSKKVPTFLIFENNKLKKKVVGSKDFKKISKDIKKLLKK